MSDAIAKPYHEMTPAERIADRIAKNRGIDERAAATRKSAGARPGETSGRQKPARTVFDKFQEIRRREGIDAASDFVRDHEK